MSAKALLLSIRPPYADAIFDGTKHYEFRKVQPKVDPGDLVLVYVTTPRCQVEGVFEVGDVLALAPQMLWRKVREKAGISWQVFVNYFEARDTAYAIEVKRVWSLAAPVPLADLRSESISPPQGYHYLSADQAMAFMRD